MDSWTSNPEKDSRANHFKMRVISVKHAGHWVHHDEFDQFIAELNTFLQGLSLVQAGRNSMRIP